MVNKETQKERILEYIREHGSITPVEALKHIGSFRLGARIYDLKQQGHDIINLNKTGDERYAKYALRRNISPVKPAEEKTPDNKGEFIEIKNRHVYGIVQVKEPCSVCGSYYQRDGICNICR